MDGSWWAPSLEIRITHHRPRPPAASQCHARPCLPCEGTYLPTYSLTSPVLSLSRRPTGNTRVLWGRATAWMMLSRTDSSVVQMTPLCRFIASI